MLYHVYIITLSFTIPPLAFGSRHDDHRSTQRE